ncbi:MAG: DNA repair protein RecN [Acidimicrobiia bacterium]|nr:DNA repair protein RecN [Acidimicrobiia bacterium]
MLLELAVADLGVIDRLSLTIPPGMIALTGETGAGKTLLVDAIDLLMGGRADPGLVRPGAAEAVVDGRFELDGEEYVLSRVVVAEGRSRAYLNGRPATASALGELGVRLVDLHGQHSHQSLLGVEAQRDALDTFGRIDLGPLLAARTALAEIDDALAAMGGDERARARELDLVRYQVGELDEADLADPDEDAKLAEAEELLANAVAHQEVAAAALDALIHDDGARDGIAGALSQLDGRGPFTGVAVRLRDVVAEIDDIGDAIRAVGDGIEPDPEELERVLARRRLLHDLCRKYGDDVATVIAERDSLRLRLKELEDHDAVAAELDAKRARAAEALANVQAKVARARRAAAPDLAAAIEAHLPALAMPNARVGVDVEGIDGGDVSFRLAANPGSDLQALAKVASGGELARAMLALRSVLSEAPPVLVFDEVDAGIGGQAGFAVGRSLSNLGDRHQVLVVTHLPQVAAFADAHLAVEKRQGDDETVSEIRLLDEDEQLVELARMLSGQPDSETARQHARELIEEASAQKRTG